MATTEASGLLETAHRRQRLLKATSSAATAEAKRLWRRVETGNIRSSWAGQVPRLLVVVSGAQLLAGQTADEYIAAALERQDIEHEPSGSINPGGLMGVASDGRPLDTLLMQPTVTTLTAISEGAAAEAALSHGLAALLTIVATQVEDAFRVAGTIAGFTRGVQMYTRALSPPSCPRCVVLLGEVSSWRTAFRRHPRCDCIQVPLGSRQDTDAITDPMAYFDSLSRAEQNRVFTVAGAQAIRDGADLRRVVNVRRRAAGLSVADSIPGARRSLQRVELANGLTVPVTYSGRKKDRRVQLMPEAIYEIARDREHALQLLAANGYIEEDWRARLMRTRGFV
jgi:hypothetical protein